MAAAAALLNVLRVETVVLVGDRFDRLVALAWSLARDVVPIPKATGDHVRENLQAREFELSASDFDAIGALEPSDRKIDQDDAAWNR